jgi:hypothetical protein
LNVTPTGEKTLRRTPPHAGHSVSVASEKDCLMSKALPHSVQRYE